MFGELGIASDNRIDDTPVLLQSAQGPAANPCVMDAEDAEQRIILSRQHVEEQRDAAEFCDRDMEILVGVGRPVVEIVGRLQEAPVPLDDASEFDRSEEHTSELQSLMRSSYAVFCLTKKTHQTHRHQQ